MSARRFPAAVAGSLVALLLYATASAFVRTIHADDSRRRSDGGATQSRAADPRRIVSLAPSVTEVLFEAGLAARVVGVTS